MNTPFKIAHLNKKKKVNKKPVFDDALVNLGLVNQKDKKETEDKKESEKSEPVME